MDGEALPRDFADFRDLHCGETIVVCGCGTSLNLLKDLDRFLTIGVNDVGRRFTPEYLVVVNERRQFDTERYAHVEGSQARAIFTPYEMPHPRAVRFRLGRRGGTERGDGQCLDYSNNSPYVAVNLARHLGAKRIGLIGVDFNDHHFFGSTGRHPLAGQLPQIDRDYAALAAACRDDGVELVNLSPTSRITSLPKVDLNWLTTTGIPPRLPANAAASAMRIVSYATTPVAGVPSILARCIAGATGQSAHCVWAGGSYGNGVAFAGGVAWGRQPREAIELLEAADVIIVHNGKIDAAHRELLKDKPLVTLAHNYAWNVDMQHVRSGQSGLVVGQYQATLPDFAGWGVVPNPIPLWEADYMPGDKNKKIIYVAYTPSGRHERYPEGHRLYWHGKGFETTQAVLHRLARLPGVVVESTYGGQVSHEQSLAMKRRAHIVIDECVTGSYHRNSLEGLAAGAVVVNGVGLLPGVERALRQCAPDMERVPFVFSSLDTLEQALRQLIEQGPEALAACGRENRAWMERHWSFARQWPLFWADACEVRPASTTARAIPVTTDPLVAPVESVAPIGFSAVVAPVAAIAPVPARRWTQSSHKESSVNGTRTEVVSVVVPHGGAERLSHLAATLATLRQRTGILEVIVVEMGPAPLAHELARRWADKHFFIDHQGAFERATTLNAALAVAAGNLLLWHDNDLLIPPDFIPRAVKELLDRTLDYLTPYSAVRYLSRADSQRVIQGTSDPAACRPENTLQSGTGASGGMGLVRRDFLLRHGGFIEGFRGWGGEDNAWNHKAGVLGRSAPTQRNDQYVHHLYHPASGGYQPGAAGRANPHYVANVELMHRICAVRNPADLAAQFPTKPGAPGRLTCFDEIEPTGPAVWVYWEGPCPDWIRACLRTLAIAAPNLRLLSAESFDHLRDHDRDINLARLQVAHRADFVRLFLLRRYGGLWVDADCLAMQPLQPVLDLLGQHETVGHRERSGLVSNGFLAARPGSRIINAVYERVCARLRSNKPLGWTSIGSEPLSAVIAEDAGGWHELPCVRIQPICWSDPGAFFAERSNANHQTAFDKNAISYMLSNTRVRQHVAQHPQADLLNAGTFFSFLLNRAMGVTDECNSAPYERVFTHHARLYRQYNDESISGPGSTLRQTQELRERLPLLLAHLGVRSLLDAPCGDFNWMQNVELGLDLYTGVDILKEVISEHAWRHTRADRRFMRADLIDGTLPQADAILCRDLLPHLSYAEIWATLRNFRRTGATYILLTTFLRPRPNRDTVGGDWRTLNLTLAPFNFPQPLFIVNEKCSESGGVFADKSLGVWRLADLNLHDLQC